MLQSKHILIGISGGIAAYKIPDLIRQLQQHGAEVRVAVTHNALNFVTELTLQTLSGSKVYSDVFAAINEHSTEHISLPDWADLMVIAPATANVIGKIANGIADDALTTTFCAMRKPVVIAPAMNDKMYSNPIVQKNISTLSKVPHVMMLDCAEGYLACGTEGKGRMQETTNILEAINIVLTPKTLKGKHILLTAGPTKEAIDPVRYISNHSTGKMGYALARECVRRGGKVTLISGPTTLPKDYIPQVLTIGQEQTALNIVHVTSAADMYQATMQAFEDADIAILCAAVADFTPVNKCNQKIKKAPNQEKYSIELKTTEDIAKATGIQKHKGQIVVGFALETDNEESNAQSKLQKKNLDYIILNSLRDSGAGFGYDTNKVTIYSKDGKEKTLPLASKEEIATSIIEYIQ